MHTCGVDGLWGERQEVCSKLAGDRRDYNGSYREGFLEREPKESLYRSSP